MRSKFENFDFLRDCQPFVKKRGIYRWKSCRCGNYCDIRYQYLIIQIPSCLRMIYALVDCDLWKALRLKIDDFRLKIEGMLSIRIKKTERSDTTNRHSSFVNHQFGYGFAGLGSGKRLGSLINFPILPVFGTSSKLLRSLKIPSDSSAIFHKHQLPSLE